MSDLAISEIPEGRFTLKGKLNRNTVPNFWPNGLAELKRSNTNSKKYDAVLDMSGISHADTAGLAWLINLLKQSRHQNIRFVLKNVPTSLINLAKISDVEGFLSVQ